MQQQAQLTGWTLKVRNWLRSVLDYQTRGFDRNISVAARDLKSDFPKSFWIWLALETIKPLGVWLVKSALRSAARDIGFTLSDDTLELLAGVRGHEKVPDYGQLRSPLVAMKSPHFWPREVPTPH